MASQRTLHAALIYVEYYVTLMYLYLHTRSLLRRRLGDLHKASRDLDHRRPRSVNDPTLVNVATTGPDTRQRDGSRLTVGQGEDVCRGA